MGHKIAPTPEQRAIVVAAYRETGDIKRVAAMNVVPFKDTVIRRILDDAGFTRRHFKRPPDDELRRLWADGWESGVSKEHLMRMIGGIQVTPRDMERIMVGIPRRTVAWKKPIPATPLPDDESVWQWFAGVFDSRGTITRQSMTSPRLSISFASDRVAADAIATIIGVGDTGTKRGKGPSLGYSWVLDRRLDVLNVLEHIAPYVRIKGPAVRRVIDELKGDTAVKRAPPDE